MGWLFGWNSAAELKTHLLRPEATSEYKVIDSATTSLGRNLWVAYEKKDSSGERILALYLMKSGGGEWGYKDLTENMGPCEVDCPLRFFDLVPLDPKAQYAGPWREKVKAYHKKRTQTFEEGQTVRVHGKLFKVIGKVKRSYIIQSLDNGGRYKCGAARMHLVTDTQPSQENSTNA